MFNATKETQMTDNLRKATKDEFLTIVPSGELPAGMTMQPHSFSTHSGHEYISNGKIVARTHRSETGIVVHYEIDPQALTGNI